MRSRTGPGIDDVEGGLVLVVAISALILAILALSVNVRAYTFFVIVYVLLVPKIGVISVPGTWVSVRGEDLLIALLVLRLIVDFALRRITLHTKYLRYLVVAFSMFLPVGVIGLLVGIENGSVASASVGILYLVRRFEYFALLIAAVVYFAGPNQHAVYARRTYTLIKFATVFNFGLALLQSAGLLGGFVRGGNYQAISSGRATSTFSGAYEFGAVAVMFAAAFVWALFRTQHKFSSCVFLAMTISSVAMTQSRSSLIALVFVLLLMIGQLARKGRLWILILGSLSALILAIVFPSAITNSRFSTISIPSMVRESLDAWNRRSYDNQLQFGTILSDMSTDASFSYRAGRWFNYIDGVLRLNPLFGLGPSAGGEAVDGNYVRIFVEFGLLGVVGLVLTVHFVKKLIRSAPASPLRAVAAWGGLSLLVQALFIDVFEASKVAETYWFILGIVVASTISPLAPAGKRRNERAPSSRRPDAVQSQEARAALERASARSAVRTMETQ